MQKEVTVAMFIDGFEFARKEYESEEVADKIIAAENEQMMAEGKEYVIWKKIGSHQQDCMKEPKFANNAELQELAEQQPYDSQTALTTMVDGRKTHL